MSQIQKATFAGGCFWCMQPAFDNFAGVIKTIVGYSGGREAIQIDYDPEKVSYKQLLELYLAQIDPTDDGGQFYDRGHKYTTAIYYHVPDQKPQAEEFLQEVDQSKRYAGPIVVKIEPYQDFEEAEDYHQKYYIKNERHYKGYKKASGREAYIEEHAKKM